MLTTNEKLKLYEVIHKEIVNTRIKLQLDPEKDETLLQLHDDLWEGINKIFESSLILSRSYIIRK